MTASLLSATPRDCNPALTCNLVRALLLGCAIPAAQAGPPLSIDDPGILAPGQWEIIAAATAASTDSEDAYQAPLLDVSLGLIEDSLQVSAAYPYVRVERKDGSTESEFGNLSLGLKWRFWNSDGLQLAFAPGYAFGVTRTNAENGIGHGGDVALLPVSAEYQINERWRFNGELGYARVEDSTDELTYGAALGYTLNKRWDLLVEIAGASHTDFDDDALNLRVGFDYTVTQDIHLLFSTATGLRERSADDELDYDVYIGVQWFR